DVGGVVDDPVAVGRRARFDVDGFGPGGQRRARVAQGPGVTEGVDLALVAEHPVARPAAAAPACGVTRPRGRTTGLATGGRGAGIGRTGGVGGVEDRPDAVVLLVGDVEGRVLQLTVVPPGAPRLERRSRA